MLSDVNFINLKEITKNKHTNRVHKRQNQSFSSSSSYPRHCVSCFEHPRIRSLERVWRESRARESGESRERDSEERECFEKRWRVGGVCGGGSTGSMFLFPLFFFLFSTFLLFCFFVVLWLIQLHSKIVLNTQEFSIV